MDPTKEFLMNFHNLKGFTLGEKRRSLFSLLNSMKLADSSSISNIITSLIPKNHLESLFQVELLIFFRRSLELFEVLKSGNEELSSKIFKQSWFFQDPFELLSAEIIVKELFPHLSYVTRNRVIRSLAKYHKNEEKIDEIFNILVEKYGINSAKLIIQGCSVAKIKEILKRHRLRLSSTDLVPMFNKDPHLFQIFMESCDIDCEDSGIVREVILKEIDVYDHNKLLYIKLGKRSTRRLLKHRKDHIISNSPQYVKILHLRTVYKFIGKNDAITFLENLFPKDFKEFYYHYHNPFLKYFPKKEHFDRYAQAFQKLYNKTIWEDERALFDDFINFIVNPEEREKWISIKIKSGTPQDTFYEYYDINKSFGLIKEKMNVTSAVRTRAGLAEKLIFACKFNNDFEALKETLQYFCKHHRNDDKLIKENFLNALSSKFQLSDLTSKHWEFINKILEIQKTKNEDFRNRRNFQFQYILHLWKNKQSCNEKIIEMITSDGFKSSDLGLIDSLKCEELEREILIQMIILLPQLTKGDPISSEDDVRCLLHLKKWNANHKNQISLTEYPRLFSSMKIYTENAIIKSGFNYLLQDIFEKFICTKERDEISQYLFEIYFQKAIKKHNYENVILWHLQNEPAHLCNYLDDVLKCLCESYRFNWKFWSYVKKLTFLGIDKKSIKYCLDNYIISYHADTLLKVLACLMRPEDFVDLVSQHVPTAERMDIDNEDDKANYKIEIAVATSFKYTKSFVVLPTLINFCIGDYLRNALESLYYLFYHSPENRLEVFLKELSNRAVSVRKHALFLTSQVGTIESVFLVFKDSAKHEKNASMKKHLLNTVLRYFNKNPSDKMFELLLSCIPSMNLVDSESIKAISSLGEIPKQYKSKYFIFVLDHLKSCAEQNIEISREVDRVLSQVDSNFMQLLPYNYCISFINKYFLQNDNCYSEKNINNFVIQFLFKCDHDFAEKLEYILEKIVHFRHNITDDPSQVTYWEKKNRVAKHTHDFLSNIVFEMQYQYPVSVRELKICLDKLLERFELENYFLSYIDLNILLMQKESVSTVEYSKKLYTFYNDVMAKYDSVMTMLFSGRIKRMAPFSNRADEIMHEICWQLWNLSHESQNCQLIIYLLPRKPPIEEKNLENYMKMLEALESTSDKCVEILFNMYIHAN